MENKEIVLSDTGLAKLTLQSPAEVIKKAGEAAEVLMQIVKEKHLSKKLGGEKEHIEYEGWAVVSRFYACTIRCPDDGVKPIGELEQGRYTGFKAHADIVNQNGDIIGGADAYCMRDEANWEKKPNFQLASMAQTRAGSKAARMIFSWVAVLAGFSPTPAEEVIPESGGSAVDKAIDNMVQGKPPKDGTPISEKQAKLLYAKCKDKGLDNKGINKLVSRYGYEKTFDVSIDDFDKILAEVEAM